MSRLVLDPPTLIQEGNHTKDIHADLVRDTNEMYNLVNELINNGFDSPGARTIAGRIMKTKDSVQELLNKVKDYSDFLFYAANTGASTDAGIADRYKINY